MTPTNTRSQGGAETVDVLEAARLSGLRSYLHGVNATDARKLLTDFLAALVAPASAQEAPPSAAVQQGEVLTDEEIDRHLDAVLRASGSALRNYSLPGNIAKMRAAMKEAMSAALASAQPKTGEAS